MASECGAVGNGNVDKWVEISKEWKVGTCCAYVCTAVKIALFSTVFALSSTVCALFRTVCIVQYSRHCSVLCALFSTLCALQYSDSTEW